MLALRLHVGSATRLQQSACTMLNAETWLLGIHRLVRLHEASLRPGAQLR